MLFLTVVQDNALCGVIPAAVHTRRKREAAQTHVVSQELLDEVLRDNDTQLTILDVSDPILSMYTAGLKAQNIFCR